MKRRKHFRRRTSKLEIMKNVSEIKVAAVVLGWFMLCFSIVAICSSQKEKSVILHEIKVVKHPEIKQHLVHKIKRHREDHQKKQTSIKPEKREPIIQTFIAFNY